MPGRRKTSSWLGNLSLYYFLVPIVVLLGAKLYLGTQLSLKLCFGCATHVSEAQLRKKLRSQVELGNEAKKHDW